MNKKLLLVALGVFIIGDTVTTITLTNLVGVAGEGNPFVKNYMEQYGSLAFIWLKLIVAVLVLPAIKILPRRMANTQLGIMLFFGLFGTVGNLYVLSLVLF